MTIETLMPPIGTEVECYFGANKYRGYVCGHGRVAPHVRFKLKSGRLVTGRATILPHGVSTAVTYRGYLAKMYHPTAYGK